MQNLLHIVISDLIFSWIKGSLDLGTYEQPKNVQGPFHGDGHNEGGPREGGGEAQGGLRHGDRGDGEGLPLQGAERRGAEEAHHEDVVLAGRTGLVVMRGRPPFPGGRQEATKSQNSKIEVVFIAKN